MKMNGFHFDVELKNNNIDNNDRYILRTIAMDIIECHKNSNKKQNIKTFKMMNELNDMYYRPILHYNERLQKKLKNKNEK